MIRAVYYEDSAARQTILIKKLGNEETSRIFMSYWVSVMSGHGIMTSRPELQVVTGDVPLVSSGAVLLCRKWCRCSPVVVVDLGTFTDLSKYLGAY